MWPTDSELERMRLEHPWLTSLARLRALRRQDKHSLDNIFQMKPEQFEYNEEKHDDTHKST
jgi:hypothetical protein